jgi:hypothetical protein
VRINGQTIINLVEKLLSVVTNLTTEVNDAILEVQISNLQDLLTTQSSHMEAAAATVLSKPGILTCKDTPASNQHCQQARTENTTKNSSFTQKPMAASAVAEVTTNKKNGVC